MKKILLMAGAAMLMSTPAVADAKPKGSKGKANVAAKIQKGQLKDRSFVDRNRNGIADWNEHWVGRGNYGGDICPPGLAKRTPRCVPPGQVGRVGGLIPTEWGMVDWDDIPLSVRQRYMLDDYWRYTYYGRRLYVVDPTTNLITRIINGILF